tara:strand:+ start:822 stop:1400 length:579 start_codon:yes stop_codon:yes gene_type:complete
MSTKSLIQSGIILIIMLILFSIYIFFFLNKEQEIISDSKTITDADNKIMELKYNAIDEEGNNYVIQSKSGKVSEKDKNILILREVTGVIKIKDTDEIIILSDIAEYNKITLDTHFYHNVKLTYEGHSINSDSLFMNYIDKNINIENNIIYKGYNNKLLADMVEIDLVSKFSKIYMLDKQNKVKVELKQNGSN